MNAIVRPGLLVLACAAVGCGCATTVERRIRANPERFAAFPLDAQEAIRRGEIRLGFTEDMVLVALGRPARVVTRTTERGESTIWLYVRYIPETHTYMAPAWSYSRGRYGAIRAYPDTIWMDRTTWREQDAARIEFRDGLVVGIERSR